MLIIKFIIVFDTVGDVGRVPVLRIFQPWTFTWHYVLEDFKNVSSILKPEKLVLSYCVLPQNFIHLDHSMVMSAQKYRHVA